MFRKWLNENDVNEFDFSSPLFPKASDRAFWDAKYDAEAIKTAESCLGCDWPLVRATQFMAFEKTGDRLAQENPHFARRQAICALVIGEILEHKGRFLPDIVDGIFAICEESYWGLSAHKAYYGHKSTYLANMKDPYIDLFAGETAATLAVTYYALYDELAEFCPDILARIEYELEHKVINPYLMHTDWFWMGYDAKWVNNWNPWILSNLLTVFLIVPMSQNTFADGIRKLIFEFQRIYDCMRDDGGCDEGATYWGVAGGAMFEFLEQLYLATSGKINFFGDEKIKNIAKYERRAYIGGGYFANFADGGTKVEMGLGYILYMFGKRIDDEMLMAFSKEIGAGDNIRNSRLRRKLFNIIHKEDIEKMGEYVPEEACILPALQNSFVRAGDWYYAAKGGHNQESHNHNDIGSFIAYFDNRPVLCDPSCGTYTRQTFSEERYTIWTMQSGWHNLPVVNETYEKEGLEFAADSFALTDKCTKISFAKAYPEAAKLNSLTRSINVTADGIEVTDNFEFLGADNKVAEAFICVLNAKIEDGKAIIGDEFVLEADIPCEICLDSVDFEGDEKLVKMWEAEKMNRISFKFSAGQETEIKFTLRRK